MLSMETLALARAYADKIKQQVGAGFMPQIVESLPATGDSKILYLVLKEGTAPQGNIYDEYLWIDGAYEHIGDTSTLITVDSALSATSENPVQNKAIKAELDTKVDKVTGKGLSANDFTTELKDKLDGVEAGANKTAVDAELSATSENPVQNKAVAAALGKKIDKPTTVKEGLLGFNSAGVETVKEITDGGNAVETDTANIPNNKALKEYVAAKNGNFISKPTSNGIVGYMSGLGTLTYTLNTSMPASPTHSGVLTAKAVKDYTDEKSDTKVDKVDGKGLSTNDFTNAQKALVEKILETGYVKGLKEDINGLIQNVPGSNSNNVLYINTEVSATKSGIPLTQAVYAAIKDNETKLNKTTSLSADSTDTQYPTAKAVYDFIMSLDASEVSY